jgi:hypothetical protein
MDLTGSSNHGLDFLKEKLLKKIYKNFGFLTNLH